MKKKWGYLGACFLVMVLASSAFAGGVVNKTNWSAEYIRTMNRNAATDYADIVFYNPAGTVHMDEGGFVNLSVHYFPKLYETRVTSGPFAGKYESDEPSMVPGLFTVYNASRWALFFGVSNTVGGGKVVYDDGSLTTVAIGAGVMQQANTQLAAGGVPQSGFYNTIKSQKIEGEQMGLGYMFGGAYKVSDLLSLSMGIRYIDAQKEAKGSVTIGNQGNPIPNVNDDLTGNVNYEWDAQGVGAILGINITPSRDTTLAARYETETSLRYSYTVNRDNLGVLAQRGITTGVTKREDHPATLGLGVSHRLNQKLRMETNLTYYFNKDADWDGAEKFFNNGFDAGLALEYAITPELLGSIGYIYTKNGIKSKYANDITINLPENPNLDSHSIGFGGAYAINPQLDLNFGAGAVFYVDDDISLPFGDATYEKTIYFGAFGVQYKFM